MTSFLLGARPTGPPPFYGAFESTYLPDHAADVATTTGHDRRWREDIDALIGVGVNRFRYPLRWHQIEATAGSFDWSETDAVMAHLERRGADLVVDLVHHTSYPAWLSDGFRDPRFGPAFLRYSEAVAHRYPHVAGYTLFNEPFATLFLAGHEALWPPYDHGAAGFVRLLHNVLPAVSEAARCWRQLAPEAAHVWVDTCEHHVGRPGEPEGYAAFANDRRHVVLDLAVKHDLDPERPFLRTLLAAGGEPLLDLQPIPVDVLGLDYYCHSEWFYELGTAITPSPHPHGFAAVAEQYGRRYGLPMLLSETNIRGLPSDRTSWLRYMLEQYEMAVERGVDLRGFCWFPSLDSCDWDSLLARPAGRVDPVGVRSLNADGSRQSTSFTAAWEAAAGGAAAADLPAYRFQPPCAEQLSGLAPQLAHWPWQDPPAEELVPALHIDITSIDITLKEPDMPTFDRADTTGTLETTGIDDVAPDLVVLSHLRWTWVWQRPQHLVSRFAARRATGGARTWFVEEPMSGDVTAPELAIDDRDGITRVWLVVPHFDNEPEVLGFEAPGAEVYGELLAKHFAAERRSARPDVLLYTPMALDIAEALDAGSLAYDVMDELAAFLKAPEGLRLRQQRLLARADVVFAGGRSLHRSVRAQRRADCHLFPSGVETAHFATSRALRTPHDRPVAGYVGVIDERVDLDLIAQLAAELPDWTIRIVGPIAKIDPGSLPQAPNLEYPGMAAYADLPAVMAGFDVALMPFALNEATRSISPTKTLEYLAAGLPVVSTRVPDVVADYDGVVHLSGTAPEFARACRDVVTHSRADRDRRLRPIQKRHEWDTIAAAMAALMSAAAAPQALANLTRAGGVPA